MWEVKVSKLDQSGVLRHHSTISREQLIIERDEREGLSNYANTRMFKPTYKSVCNFCKKEFQSMKKNQMFCPHQVMMRKESCAYLFNKERKKKPVIKKECLCCKKIYETRIPHQIFCANPCKSGNLKIRRQECVCGRKFRTHRDEIQTCTKCRGTDQKYGRRY
tara:strand:- start:48 stop:536 length:489 start_codon:yes stop_codon:yes gene_type:complete